MGFYETFVNFMLIGLLAFSLFAFTVSFQSENGVEDKIIDNNIFNKAYGNLRGNLEDLSTESQAQKTLFESENPTGGFGTILLFSIVSSGKVFNGMVIGVFNTITKLPASVLGLDPIVTSVIGTILIITIIIGLWIIYKLGG